MEQIDQTLIERYLADELTLSERNEVERRAKDDAQFRKDLAECKLSIEAIRLSEREELKNRFRQRDKMLDKKNNNRSSGKRVSIWWMAVAAVVSLLVAWYFLYAPDSPSDETKSIQKDTTQINQNPPVIIDTIQANDVKKDEIKTTKENIKPKKTGDQIFAENFEVYKDESMNPASRSDEEQMNAFEKFELHYWDGKNKEALTAFDNMTPAQKQNDNLRFKYANVLMALNRTNEASLMLTAIVRNSKTLFGTEPYLYLALCNIKAGRDDEARKNLQTYLDAPASLQKEKAKKILTQLK